MATALELQTGISGERLPPEERQRFESYAAEYSRGSEWIGIKRGKQNTPTRWLASLFLTLAPQMAGRNSTPDRPALIRNLAFLLTLRGRNC